MTTILIADDHPMVLSGIRAVLENTPFEVIASAENGLQVLSTLASAKPDILLLDFNMPELNGLQVLRTLRERKDKRLVVLLMADISQHDLREAIQLGANGVILKQTAPSQLLLCLEHVLGGGRWIDQNLMERALGDVSEAEDPVRRAVEALTPRERTMAQLVGTGLSNRDIAEELGLTEGAVKVIFHRMYMKLGIANRVELALVARRLIPRLPPPAI